MNAAAEAFFAALKPELAWIHRTEHWNTKAELRTALFDYIETPHQPICQAATGAEVMGRARSLS
jgi:hypothetical protein